MKRRKKMQNTFPLSIRFTASINPLFNKLNSYISWKEGWGKEEEEWFGLILIRSNKVSVSPLHNDPQFGGFRQIWREQELYSTFSHFWFPNYDSEDTQDLIPWLLHCQCPWFLVTSQTWFVLSCLPKTIATSHGNLCCFSLGQPNFYWPFQRKARVPSVKTASFVIPLPLYIYPSWQY